MAGHHLSLIELILRLGAALVYGAAIGAERQWRQRMAGLRTYSLVSVGASLFILLAPLVGAETEAYRHQSDARRSDRIDSQVEQIASRLTLERDIVGVSWRALPTAAVE